MENEQNNNVEVEETKPTPQDTEGTLENENSGGSSSDVESKDINKTDEESREASIQKDIEELDTTMKDLSEDLEKRGVDFDGIGKRYLESGEISEKDLQTLEKAGYPKTVIDGFVKNYERQVQAFNNEVFSYVGGEEEFGKVAEFVKSQGDESIDAFNAVVNTGNLGVIRMALKGIQADMVKNYGTAKKTIMGTDSVGESAGENTGGFENQQKMFEAMRDPRYRKDKAYREAVEQRMLKTKF